MYEVLPVASLVKTAKKGAHGGQKLKKIESKINTFSKQQRYFSLAGASDDISCTEIVVQDQSQKERKAGSSRLQAEKSASQKKIKASTFFSPQKKKRQPIKLLKTTKSKVKQRPGQSSAKTSVLKPTPTQIQIMSHSEQV